MYTNLKFLEGKMPETPARIDLTVEWEVRHCPRRRPGSGGRRRWAWPPPPSGSGPPCYYCSDSVTSDLQIPVPVLKSINQFSLKAGNFLQCWEQGPKWKSWISVPDPTLEWAQMSELPPTAMTRPALMKLFTTDRGVSDSDPGKKLIFKFFSTSKPQNWL